MPKIYRLTFNRFDKGMMDAVDSFDVPPEAGRKAVNVDISTYPGCLAKSPGVSLFTLGGLLPDGKLESPYPPGNIHILSLGRLVYNKVWSDAGQTKANQTWERLFIQFDGEKGLDWFETERQVGVNIWSEPEWKWLGFNTDGDPIGQAGLASTYQFGSTRAGRIRWLEHKGVLRAACGAFINKDDGSSLYNTSDSFPFLWLYVDRYPTDPDYGEVNGYFQVYDYGAALQGQCRLGFAGIYPSRGMPNYSLGTSEFQIIENEEGLGNFFFYVPWGMGWSSTTNFKYVLLPIYDGHQISPARDEALATYYPAYVNNNLPGATKMRITILNFAEETAFPRRLSGFNLYRATADLGKITDEAGATGTPPGHSYFGNYQWIKHVDIRKGNENAWSFRGKYLEQSGIAFAQIYVNFTSNDTYYPGAEDFFKNLYIQYLDDNGTERETIIIDHYYLVGGAPPGILANILFGTLGNNGLTNGESYNFKINERWRLSGDDVLIDIIDPFLLSMGDSPPWLIPDEPIEDFPEVECNYGGQDIFKDMHVVWDVAYDDILEPNMLRLSYPANHPFAGHDSFSRYLIPTGLPRDEEIKGAFNYLDFLVIFTEKRIFKYYIAQDGSVEVLAEQIWDHGLKSIDSLVEIDGLSYFLGTSGSETSIFVWDGTGKPRNVGGLIRPTLDAALGLTNANPEYAQGIPLLHEKKYLLHIPVMT